MLDLVVGDAVLAGNEPLDHLRPSQGSVPVLVQFTVETVLLRDDPVLVLILSSVTYVLLETAVQDGSLFEAAFSVMASFSYYMDHPINGKLERNAVASTHLKVNDAVSVLVLVPQERLHDCIVHALILFWVAERQELSLAQFAITVLEQHFDW